MWFHEPHDNPRVSLQRQNLFEVEEVNCICVDWKKGSQTTYTQAANNVRVVGAQVAQMLATLQVSDSPTAEKACRAHQSPQGKDAAVVIFLKRKKKELTFLLEPYF